MVTVYIPIFASKPSLQKQNTLTSTVEYNVLQEVVEQSRVALK